MTGGRKKLRIKSGKKERKVIKKTKSEPKANRNMEGEKDALDLENVGNQVIIEGACGIADEMEEIQVKLKNCKLSNEEEKDETLDEDIICDKCEKECKGEWLSCDTCDT